MRDNLGWIVSGIKSMSSAEWLQTKHTGAYIQFCLVKFMIVTLTRLHETMLFYMWLCPSNRENKLSPLGAGMKSNINLMKRRERSAGSQSFQQFTLPGTLWLISGIWMSAELSSNSSFVKSMDGGHLLSCSPQRPQTMTRMWFHELRSSWKSMM